MRTPNIDRLAGSGIRFNRAYVNNPLCMPYELNNLWDKAEHREMKRELLVQLMERIVLTDSALPRRLCHA